MAFPPAILTDFAGVLLGWMLLILARISWSQSLGERRNTNKEHVVVGGFEGAECLPITIVRFALLLTIYR
jgi:hypothetical protein